MQEHTPGQFSQRVIERAREANTPTPSSIGGQIAKRPWLSVGLALAAGYMLGGRSEPRASWSPERSRTNARVAGCCRCLARPCPAKSWPP